MPSRPSDGIRRRDFLNGLRLAAGGAAVRGFFPMRAFAHSTVGRGEGDGGVGEDPGFQRGGNQPAAFNVGHWMRDGRLSYTSSSVVVSSSRYDDVSGSFDLFEEGGTWDVIVVGAGISGLTAAWHLRRDYPSARILVLDGNGYVGGNASRDTGDLVAPAASGAAYCVWPYADFLFDFYGGLGVDYERYAVADPGYAYFFDENTPHVNAGTRGWTNDVYGDGLRDMPYPAELIQDLQKAKQDFRNWYNRAGSPTDPADDSDPQYDYLAQMTLAEYFESQGYHDGVRTFYDQYAIDALAGQCHQVNAYTSISFLGGEYNPSFAMPGGNDGITRHLVRALVPGAISGATTADLVAATLRTEELDRNGNDVRIRLGGMVLRVDNEGSQATAVFYKDGKFYKARAGAVICAGGQHTSHRMAEHLLSSAALEAWKSIRTVPVITANVQLRRARPIVNLCNAYDLYWWGSTYWADAVVADWTSGNIDDPDRPVVLTFYGGNWADEEDMPEERLKLLTTEFGAYEDSLREDLNRVFAADGFDFDADVEQVALYRWGHGMVYPAVGKPHGAPIDKKGRTTRTDAPRHIARAQIDRISFAGQETESSPAIESAIASGIRTAEEALQTI